MRTFKPQWLVGKSWLVDSETGMKCTRCISHKGALQTRQLLNSLTFINGCQTYKSESISWHEKSKAHIFAEKCKNATENPADTPVNKAKCALITKNATQQRRLFQTVFAVAKHRKSFKDYILICDLQEANGVEMGKTFRNAKQCANFIGSIAESYRSQMRTQLTIAPSHSSSASVLTGQLIRQ